MTQNIVEQLRRSTVFGTDGEKIGKIGVVYVDADSAQPTFVTVNTGLFGTNESFVPVHDAKFNGDDVTVPYTKEFVKDAPNIAEDGELSPEEEQRLYEYYSLNGNTAHAGHTDRDATAGTTAGTAGVANSAHGAGADTTRRDADLDRDRHADRDHHAHAGHEGRDGDVVAHEERLRVDNSATARETGRVRLRKVTHTDTETVEVPVRREEIHVEREKIDPNSAEARTTHHDFDAKDEDITVTAYEERPNVSVDTVATERVNVSKDVHTDKERVSGEVHKEEIVVEGDDTTARTDADRKGRL